MIDLGSLNPGSDSVATGVNNSGQVVGYSVTASGVTHAFLYENGSMIDLNSLAAAAKGWTLSRATAINNEGEIVGDCISPNGTTHAFLLRPPNDPYNVDAVGVSTTLTAAVTKSTLPVSAPGTGRIHGAIKLTITNSSMIENTGADLVQIYATTTGTIDSSSVLLGKVRKRLALKPGAIAKISVNVAGIFLPIGTYTILTKTTDGTGNATDAATGPTIDVAAPFISISAVLSAVSTTSVSAGKSIPLTLTLTNAGNIDSTGVATFTIGLDVAGVSAIPVVSMNKRLRIKPGTKPTIVHFKIRIPSDTPAGTYAPYVNFTQGTATLTANSTTDVTII